MTLPEEFKRNGYHCLSNGKVFHHRTTRPSGVGARPLETEFGRSLLYRSEVRVNDWRTKEALVPFGKRPGGRRQRIPGRSDCRQDDCRSQAHEKRADPSFWPVGSRSPTFLYAPEKYWDLYEPRPPSNLPTTANARRTPLRRSGARARFTMYHRPGNEVQRRGMAAGHACTGYYACVSYVDAQIGKIMKTLDDLDLRENTIIVLWGDHGWHLGEHTFWGKHNTHAPIDLHCALIISAPGFKPDNRDRLGGAVASCPTLVDLSRARVMHDQGLEGDELHALAGESPLCRRENAVFLPIQIRARRC